MTAQELLRQLGYGMTQPKAIKQAGCKQFVADVFDGMKVSIICTPTKARDYARVSTWVTGWDGYYKPALSCNNAITIDEYNDL
jgi:hypothetical protein